MPGREHSDRKVRRHAPCPGAGQLDRRHRGTRGQIQHLLPRSDAQRQPGGTTPIPVLAERQHGVGQVVAPGDPVEHRRHLARILVEGGAAHDAEPTCAALRRCGPRSGRRRSSAIGGGDARPTDALHNGVGEKVWFITGTSRGFGREWAIAALERGDEVAATARNTAALADLVDKYGDAILPIQLDVTDRDADFAAVKQAHDHFGRLDIVVNNAGYGQFGFVEELSEQDARDQIETNVFGALWVTQAALPYLREQRSGHIIQVSSIGGITAFPNVGIYHASKWALEGFSQALAQEVASFGVHVTLIEPAGFSTDWSGSSSRTAEALPAYADLHAENERGRKTRWAAPGDPKASAAAVLKVVDAEQPPLRVFFGDAPLGLAKADYEQRLRTWEEWQPVAELAQG